MAGRAHGSYQRLSPGGSWWGSEYTLMECTGCGGPFVVESSSPAYNDFGEFDDNCWSSPQQVLPQIDEIVDVSVPKAIANSYIEARRCLRGRNYTAAVLMARRTVEILCKHFDAAGRDLKARLQSLKTQAILDSRMHSWADDVLRALGNRGAHDVEDVDADDAADALEFTKAIVWYVFVFNAAFDRHMARREPDATARTVESEEPATEHRSHDAKIP
jgi:hypothetical protein